MLKSISIVLLLGFALACDAQSKKDSGSVKVNTVYIEALGNGLIGSIAYDRIFAIKDKYMLSAGLGFLFFPERNSPYTRMSFPLRMSVLFSGNGIDHLEIGTGATYSKGLYSSGPSFRSSRLSAVLNVGYRRQELTGGLFFRVGVFAIAPLVEFSTLPSYEDFSPGIFPWGGLGVGYTF